VKLVTIKIRTAATAVRLIVCMSKRITNAQYPDSLAPIRGLIPKYDGSAAMASFSPERLVMTITRSAAMVALLTAKRLNRGLFV
jgi:hypothetical protein